MNYLSEEAGSGDVDINPDTPVIPNTGMFNPTVRSKSEEIFSYV